MGWSRTDDLDRSGGAEPVTFGFLGQAYVLDLAPGNQKKLQQVLQPYLTVASAYGELPAPPEVVGPQDELVAPVKAPRAARKTAAKAASKPKRKRVRPQTRFQAIRDWANTSGWSVQSTGRIPQEVIDAYEAEHPGQ